MTTGVKAIMFDFGGVLAEEGFEAGLKAIAQRNRLDPGAFFFLADQLIHETGYLTGRTGESFYWAALRERTGIPETDQQLRDDILNRFVARPRMLDLVDRLRSAGFMTVLLSDQTNWLEEIDRATSLYPHFDRVFNSFRTRLSKRDGSTFSTVVNMLGLPAAAVLFIDDNKGHVDRAAAAGLRAMHFTSIDQCADDVRLATGIA